MRKFLSLFFLMICFSLKILAGDSEVLKPNISVDDTIPIILQGCALYNFYPHFLLYNFGEEKYESSMRILGINLIEINGEKHNWIRMESDGHQICFYLTDKRQLFILFDPDHFYKITFLNPKM